MEITSEVLSKVGNAGRYNPAARSALPRGHIIADNAVIKLYQMLVAGSQGTRPFHINELIWFGNEVLDKIERKGIPIGTGLGFAIASEDVFNVSMWGTKDYPSVPIQTVFTFNREKRVMTPVDIRIDGSYCAWEFAIANHEASAWRRFLYSARRGSDKMKYIDDFFRGRVE